MLELWMAILPLILWFLERFLPFPVLIEEAAKAIFVVRAVSKKQALTLGLLFGISEAILFLINANLLLNLNSFWLRLVLTVPMHGVTALLIYLGGKRYWWLGLAGAIAVHELFNLAVRS